LLWYLASQSERAASRVSMVELSYDLGQGFFECGESSDSFKLYKLVVALVIGQPV